MHNIMSRMMYMSCMAHQMDNMPDRYVWRGIYSMHDIYVVSDMYVMRDIYASHDIYGWHDEYVMLSLCHAWDIRYT